jgi:hypothetical protein
MKWRLRMVYWKGLERARERERAVTDYFKQLIKVRLEGLRCTKKNQNY